MLTGAAREFVCRSLGHHNREVGRISVSERFQQREVLLEGRKYAAEIVAFESVAFGDGANDRS